LTAKELPKYDPAHNANHSAPCAEWPAEEESGFALAGVQAKTHERKTIMKSIICLTIGIALSCLASAIAQEESPSPSGGENASTTVEETSTATAAPESKPTATPQEKKAASSPAAQKKEAPAAQKKESAAAPGKVAAKPAKKMSVEATLKDMESRWEAAYGTHNVAVAQSMLADDFLGVYWDGRIMKKSNVVSEMKKDKDTYKSAVNERMTVRQYGRGVAVVIGTAHEKGTAKDGKAFDRSFRYTDTWVERNGRWQCVASHVMKVRG
jgi:ketosteroid isomerase-like protein